MILSNWLRPLRSRIVSRRKSWEQTHAAADTRTEQSVERLETRLYLSGLSSYTTASSDWFGVVDASFSSSSGISGSSTSGGTSSGEAVVRQFLVRLTPEATAQAGSLAGVQNLISDNAVELIVTDGLGLPGQVIVSTTERDSVQVVRSLEDNPSVAYFEEDFSVGATQLPSEDASSPEFTRQYGLNNTGQSGGVADVDIDAPEAWDITTGSVETVVSVIDSGVDFTHPDLYFNIWLNQGELPRQFAASLIDANSDELITFRDLNDAANSSFVNDLNGNGYIDAGDLLNDPTWADGIDTDNNGFEDDLVGWDFFQNDNKPFDEHRHGTHVAGILGAVGDNGFGVSGVNWQTSIMPLRFLDEDNRGDVSSAVEAINYTTMMRTRTEDSVNVRVSNNSWGSSGAFSPTLFDAVAGNLGADILFVAAAGNGDVLGQGIDNDDVSFFPANLDLGNVISVAAINDRGELASFSNFGTTTVDIAAPGVSILSTDAGGGFISRSGTSMATPFVAGTAALVFDEFPAATAAEVRDAILSGGVITPSLEGKIRSIPLSGTDQAGGPRSLNAFGALTASTFAPVPELVPVATITADGTLNIDISVTYTDDGSVDTNSFDVRDVEVTRKGFSETLLTPAKAAKTMINVDGQDRDAAVYTFTAPGGTFDATDNGTWFVSLREGEIQDNLGLYSAPRELGQFTVSIDTANVIFVNTTLDTIDADLGDGVPEDSIGRTSLRAAIMHANQAGAATTIVVPDGVYALTIPGQNENAAATGDLDLTSSQGITIVGGGGFATMIDAQQLDRVFDVTVGATATLRGLGIRNGNADQGGGVQNSGTLTIEETLIAANTAENSGGGIDSSGVLTITDSSIEENAVTSRLFATGGGGIAVNGNSATSAGSTTISRSSIVNNTSAVSGGGLLADDAELTLTNVTIAANTAERSDGGGAHIRTSDTTKHSKLTSVTITGNAALAGSGGGLMTSTSTAQVRVSNSIIASNIARTSPAVEGLITSDGDNLFGQPSETASGWRTLSLNTADFDQIGTTQNPLDPQLLRLERSSGVIQTQTPVAAGRSSNDDLAGIANLALTPGPPIVYSTVELEPNNSRGQAMRLDDRGWSLNSDPDIANSTTIPHVTITGTGDGTLDYFSFTVSEPNTTAMFDIDNGALAAEEVFDTVLFLFDSSDNLLASNDNASIDAGSTSDEDSRIEYTFIEPGYYTIEVAKSHVGTGASFGTALPADKSYVLQLSVDHHALASVTYAPSSADDTIVPLAGNAAGGKYVFAATTVGGSLQAEKKFTAGHEPVSMVIGDVNGDGFDDVVTANRGRSLAFLFADPGGNNVSVLLGNGDGTLQAPQNFTAGDNPYSVILGDINGDGHEDIITANADSDDVSILSGNGDGTFQPTRNYTTGDNPRSVALGDVDDDGISDIVTANRDGNNVSVLHGNADGTFQKSLSFPVGSAPYSVVLSDTNGDGLNDIVTANRDSNNVSVLSGNNDGTFQIARNFAAGDGPYSVVIADIDGDGFDDIVTANSLSDNISVLSGIGDGTFEGAKNFAVGDRPRSVAVADFNGDGRKDIVTGNLGFEADSNSVSVLSPNGDGTFQAAKNFAVGGLPQSVALADLNGDGLGDILTANRKVGNGSVTSGNGEISVLRGNGDGTFQTAQNFTTGDQPYSVAFGDVDGDSVGDVVTANRFGDNVSVLRGNGDGTFQSAHNFAVGDSPQSVALGDVNGDGINDIVTANAYSRNISVLRGNGDGTFQEAKNYSTGNIPASIVLGDVDGDGLKDIVTATPYNDSVRVLYGRSDGTFQVAQNFMTGDNPRAVALGDVDGDGLDDIVTANGLGDSVSVLRRNGLGAFQVAQDFGTGDNPQSVVLGDVNSDGFNDIITADRDSKTISVLRGNGDGTFQAAQDYETADGPYSVVLGDVDGDGVNDIVTALRNRNSVVALRGNGDGTFQTAQSFAVGSDPRWVVLGDVNGDGLKDVVSANSGSDNVSVLRTDSAALLEFSVGAGVLESIPLRESPLLFTSENGAIYWLSESGSADPNIRSFSLWSYSRLNGVNEMASFFVPASAGLPVRLNKAESTFVIETENLSRVFDIVGDEFIARDVGDGTFQAARNFAVGDGPGSVILSDVNGDGVNDIVTANRFSDNVSVLRGNGDGTFKIPENFPAGNGSHSVALGDISGDGINDIVTHNRYNNQSLSVLHGNADGTFQSSNNLLTLDSIRSVTIGDVNGDGFNDIVTANADTDSNVSVILGNGDGTFQSAQSFPTGEVPYSVILGDVNGDGDIDIITANVASDDVSVLRGNGDGTFQTAQNFATGDSPRSVVAGDVNGDGVADIITGSNIRDNVSLLLGVGDGTFQAAQSFPTGDQPYSVILSDVNGDGKNDIITANLGSDNVSVLRGNGDGTFRTAQNFAAGDSPMSVVAGDVNGDGIVDIVTANDRSGDVSVLLGIPSFVGIQQVSGTTIIAGRADLRVREAETSPLIPLLVEPAESVVGPLLHLRDYEFVRLAAFEEKLLATVRLTVETVRPGELQLLLIDSPRFDQDGNTIPSSVENLTLNSTIRLAGGESRQLYVNGGRVYLTAEIAQSGIGDELLVFDRSSGLNLVGDLLPGEQSSGVRDFVATGDDVYFSALSSRIDTKTQQTTLRRELFVVDLDNEVRVVRAGQEVTIRPSEVDGTLFFGSQVNAGDPSLLFQFDISVTGITPIGAFETFAGSVLGTVFLDRDRDGQQSLDERGRTGVTLFVDLNSNGRMEEGEPLAISRDDDLGTPEDETGHYRFDDLPAGRYQIREVLGSGFDQTTPLSVQKASPVLTELASVTRRGSGPEFGVPSVVGQKLVYTNQLSGELIQQQGDQPAAPVVTLQTMLPNDVTAIQSIGFSHAQDGSQTIFTVTMIDGRELVVTADSTGRLNVVADTGTAVTAVTPGSAPILTILSDIEDIRNGGFDSLSVSGDTVGFLAEVSPNHHYLLGDARRFVSLDHAQVILDSGNEIFVDRVIEDSEIPLTAADLFLDKSTLDARIGGNTGWQITTSTGQEILPLTFFDRIFDVSISGLSAVFRAIDSGGNESVFVSSVSGGLVRIADGQTTIPDGTGSFTEFGSVMDNINVPSVALDGERLVLIGKGSGDQIGLYVLIDGELRTVVDKSTTWGGKTLADLSIGHQAISGNRIAFRATFTDGTEGIYQAVLPAEPVATVTVVAGQTTSGVFFGASARPGTIRGTSFTDLDVDGVFDAGEDGNVGRTVFLDANLNGQLDDSEIRTVTDSDGGFVFNDLPAETEYVVREVVPEGLAVTVPQSLAEATVRLRAAGTVEVVLGSIDSGALGNSADGVVTGVVFNDADGNGERGDASAEPGMPNLTVFVDENGDGILNGGERSSQTTADGSYTIDQLRGTRQAVRVVLPGSATDQTSPLGNTFSTSNLRTVDSPVEVVAGDFNGDGVDDIVTTINQASEVRLFLNDGAGGFIAGASVEVSGGPGSIAVGSFQGASERDGLVVGHRTTSSVKLLLPQPDNSFDSVDLIRPQDILSGGQYQGLGLGPFMVTTGDFNGDGNDDIAVASQSALPSGGAVAVFLSDGDGTFTHEQTLTLPRADADFPTAITAGLINSGETVDLVLSNLGTANVTILSNSGVAGSNRFSIDQHLPVLGRAPSSVQVGDLDGDGDNEIVTTNLLSNNVSIFDNNGDGTFGTATVLTAGQGPAFSRLVDLDQNGSLDIAFSNSEAGNRFGILRNRGDGTFLAAETSGLALLSDGTLAFSLAVGRFNDDNGDGVIDELDNPDVVVSNRSGESLNAGAGGLTVGLNAIVPGALTVELPTDTRSSSGLNFGLRTVNLPPTITTPDNPAAIDEDAGQQTVVLTGITTGGETEDLQVSVVSDNTSLIVPTVTFDSEAGTATVRYTPTADLSGSALLTVTVRDPGPDGEFNVGAPDSDDGIVTETFNVVVRPVNDDPNAPTQTVSAERAELSALRGGTVSFDLKYDASDADSTLSGLSFRLHFDSSKLSWVAATNLLDNGFDIASAGSPQADSSDLDGNAATDSFVLFNYLDNDLQFPGESLPATLATVTFNVSESLESATPVTFSEFETAATDDQQSFYQFDSVGTTVSPSVVNLDVDDDGRVRANTDGLTILRYLLGQRGADLARTVFLGGNRTDPVEIAAFLDAGLGTMLDVDDDGRSRANTDGLTILRYMLGQDNTDLVRTIFLGGQRTDAADVRSHLESFDPTVTAVSSATTAARPSPVEIRTEPTVNRLQFRLPFSAAGAATSELEAIALLEDDAPNALASNSVGTNPNATVKEDEDSSFSAEIDAVLSANEWLYQI